jgi:hypothetical protein
MTVRIFMIVIGSFELDCYTKFISMRKDLFKQYNIEHRFVYDDTVPDTYSLDTNDICIPKLTPPYPVTNYNNSKPNALNPHMTLKFLKALKQIPIHTYDYVIRLNLSTYINIKKLLKFLELAPREKYAAGYTMCFQIPDWSISPVNPVHFISGTCMIFSRDVVEYFVTLPYDTPVLYEHNDDVVLSHISKELTSKLTHIPMVFLENENYPSSKQIEECMIFRIKHHLDRNKDINHWVYLMSQIDMISIRDRETV